VSALQGTPPKRTITLSQHPGDEKAIWWCINTYNGSTWSLKILPGTSTTYQVDSTVQEYAVSAVDRSGNESARIQPTEVSGWNEY
jgi:hypothetical protein